jgi:putative transposase
MSHRLSHNIPGHAHFLTFSCYQRQKFLIDDLVCSTLAVAIDTAREVENFNLWAYVFMPEHVHLLIHPRREDYMIAKILRRIKEPVSREVLTRWREFDPERMRLTQDTTHGPVMHRFWQPSGGFDRNVHQTEVISKAIDYIEWNPVRRGLVTDPIGWRWSSARARAGLAGAALGIDEVSWELNGPV